MVNYYFHNGKRLFDTGKVAAAVECCCTQPVDCERFRGIAHSEDAHAHADSVWVRFGDWGDASPYYYEPGSVDNECCDTLDGDYELLIRDFDDPTPEYDEFGCFPGMFMPTCMPCHDCEDLSNEPFTFAYLTAACDECEVPEGVDTSYCKSYNYLAPEGFDVLWTVVVEIYGYYSDVCTLGACVGEYPEGSTYKLLVVYQAYAPSSAAPHNYAGGHLLTKVLVDAPTDGDPPNDWAQFYCEPPETCWLFADVEPPPP